MLIYVHIKDRQTDRGTDKHIKSIVRNLTKRKMYSTFKYTKNNHFYFIKSGSKALVLE